MTKATGMATGTATAMAMTKASGMATATEMAMTKATGMATETATAMVMATATEMEMGRAIADRGRGPRRTGLMKSRSGIGPLADSWWY